MAKSMTGFGRSKYENEGREYTVEIKSVNHKYCDVSIKMPRIISYLEDNVKKEVMKNISRGKIDVWINFNNYSEKGKNIHINKEVANMYIRQLKELAESAGIKQEISVIEISKFPDVLTVENIEDEELIQEELISTVSEAVQSLVSMRQIEANRLVEDLRKRMKYILNKVNEISKNSTGLIEEYIVKLESRIKEILKTDSVDKERLALETVIYADKCSIEEEITRLKSHIVQFDTLLEKENIGKRLDFLLQEMNREINTIGSKAGSLAITNLVVDVKSELENIREQVQNIE